jgi:hypothetical protein
LKDDGKKGNKKGTKGRDVRRKWYERGRIVRRKDAKTQRRECQERRKGGTTERQKGGKVERWKGS